MTAVPGAVTLAAYPAISWVDWPTGCSVHPTLELLVLAYILGHLAGAALGVVGGLVWLCLGLRGRWDVALGIASAANVSPLVYVVVAQPAGPW